MGYDYFGAELAKAKEYALRGWDFNKDQYYVVMKTCNDYGTASEQGMLARNILYTLKQNDWRSLQYVSDRNRNDEEYYAKQGYRLY